MNEFFEYISKNLPSSAADAVLRLLFALIVLIVGLKIVKLISKRIDKVKRTRSLDESAFSFIRSLASIVCNTIIVITAASILGVPLTAIVTLLGSAGLAVGLALQGSLSNFAGGLMVLVFRPFQVGDYISNHTDEGTVTSISIFYTTLKTADNRRIVIPNGAITNQSLINFSANPTRRIDLEFSVSYDSDIGKVLETIKNTASDTEAVLKDPVTESFMIRQDASALVFGLRAWCATSDYLATKYRIVENMTRAFNDAGIEIPYQKIDIQSRAVRQEISENTTEKR